MIITKQEIDLGSLIYHEQIDKYDGEPHNYWFIEGYVPLDVLSINKKYFIKDDSQYGKTEVDQAIEVGTYFVEISYSFKDSVNPDNYEIKNIPLDYGILIIEAAE